MLKLVRPFNKTLQLHIVCGTDAWAEVIGRHCTVLGRYEVWLARIIDFDSDYWKVGLKSNSVLESELKLELEFLIFFFGGGGAGGGNSGQELWVNWQLDTGFRLSYSELELSLITRTGATIRT